MFGTSGIRGAVGETVTTRIAVDLGEAVASWGAERVVVGRDPRPSGSFLMDAVMSGVRACGADVIDIGIAATPTIARAVSWRDADAGIVVTASHNPPTDNGFKLWLPSGQAFRPAEQRQIESLMREEMSRDGRTWDAGGTRSVWGVADRRHVEAVTSAVDIERPLDVVVDIGNGAGQVTATALEALGCSVRTLNGQPDGRFPGRPSEPTEANCSDLRAVVPAISADLGIAHDGDADRMRAVDENGTFPTGDALLALFGVGAVGDGDGIAAPIDTSLAVDDALKERGATVTRTPVGDVFVADRIVEDELVFGGEPSGAWIWPGETLCPDGPLAACKLVELVARNGPLSTQLERIETYPIRRTSIRVADKPTVMRRVTETVLTAYEDVETLDGVRVDTEDGWFLVRPSGTEPVVRVTAEARDLDAADALLEKGEQFVTDARDGNA